MRIITGSAYHLSIIYLKENMEKLSQEAKREKWRLKSARFRSRRPERTEEIRKKCLLKNPNSKRESDKKYQLKNKSKLKEKAQEYYKKNSQKYIEKSLRSYYKLSIGQYDKMFKDQEERCAICNRHQENFSRRLFVDHDHKTGRIRGLLCGPCNSGIGMLGDNIEILQGAIDYLNKSNNAKLQNKHL